MAMPKADLLRSELYADWFRPQDFYSVMAFPTLFKESASSVVVAFRGRTAGDFEAEDLARLGRFAGHFGRALGMRMDREQAFGQFAAANFLLDEVPDAVLLIDCEARPAHANAAARAMLDAGQSIRLSRGRLELQDPEADARFRRMAALRRDGEIRLAGFGALILRLHACAEPLGLAGAGLLTVRIIDPNRERERPTATRLRARLGLTPRQAETFAALARGATEDEAAEGMGLRATTLRTHVRRAYARLDLHSRADLAALLARHGFETARPPK